MSAEESGTFLEVNTRLDVNSRHVLYLMGEYLIMGNTQECVDELTAVIDELTAARDKLKGEG